jgi:hypothetical protein
MLIFSAVFITLSVPIANTLSLFYLYHPMVAYPELPAPSVSWNRKQTKQSL